MEDDSLARYRQECKFGEKIEFIYEAHCNDIHSTCCFITSASGEIESNKGSSEKGDSRGENDEFTN